MKAKGTDATNAIAEAVYQKLQASKRGKVSVSDVQDILSKLDLSEQSLPRAVPALRINYLRFSGEKTLANVDAPQPFVYEQEFADGVNVLLVEDNNIGKSSVMKTIEFALTGSRDSFDADVRSWIKKIWLAIKVGAQIYTIVIDTSERVRGCIVAGQSDEDYDSIDHGKALFRAESEVKLQQELQHFFFQRFGLSTLGWVAAHGESDVISQASWRTYIQPLIFDHRAHEYLLCDPAHSYGNQQGLIFSALLGLHHATALNRLGIDKSIRQRSEKLSKENVDELENALKDEESALAKTRTAIRQIDEAVAERHEAFGKSSHSGRLQALHTELNELHAEGRVKAAEREGLKSEIRKLRASVYRTEEAISLNLHFTGIEVSMCPNCEEAVEPVAIQREAEHHECRLCSKPAKQATTSTIDDLKAKKTALESALQRATEVRDGVSLRLEELRRHISTAEQGIAETTDVITRGLSVAMPTNEEKAKKEALLEDVGRLKASIATKRQALMRQTADKDDHAVRGYVIEKVRDHLKAVAAEKNKKVLERLAELTQGFAARMGTESITDVHCTPLGVLQLKKHGRSVSFTGINNPGERLRVKLAFFLALAMLSREPKGARHPGLLLIDQPGAAEIVEEDFKGLAKILKELDREFEVDLQMFCFTSRAEFRAATRAKKIFGAQAGKYVF